MWSMIAGDEGRLDGWRERFNRIDVKLTRWMARYGIVLLRVSLGLVFLWFGFLKFFPGLSPAEELVTNTINRLSFGLIPPATAAFLVAALETLIGLGLITGVLMRVTLLLLAFQMIGTATPIFLFPDQVFQIVPFVPTLEGQYIIKNLVLISAGLVIGATVRGGRLVAEP
ncbi:MAG TPA: DoxX family protein [Anaerolineae bacterium]|nr:DoxX family protein [Anaerolineae bacterium]